MAKNGRHGNTVHGADRALARLRLRLPLDGAALEVLGEVLAEYLEVGRAAMVEMDALEFEAVARLYWNSMQHAADLKQHDRFHSYVSTWRQLKSSAVSTWREVREEQKAAPDLAYDITDAIQAADEVSDG